MTAGPDGRQQKQRPATGKPAPVPSPQPPTPPPASCGRAHHGRRERRSGSLRRGDPLAWVVEAFGCQVALALPARVKEEGEVSWVVGGQQRGLVGRKVHQEGPVPGCERHILGFDVAVAHAPPVRLRQRQQQLVRDPALLGWVGYRGGGRGLVRVGGLVAGASWCHSAGLDAAAHPTAWQPQVPPPTHPPAARHLHPHARTFSMRVRKGREEMRCARLAARYWRSRHAARSVSTTRCEGHTCGASSPASRVRTSARRSR